MTNVFPPCKIAWILSFSLIVEISSSVLKELLIADKPEDTVYDFGHQTGSASIKYGNRMQGKSLISWQLGSISQTKVPF